MTLQESQKTVSAHCELTLCAEFLVVSAVVSTLGWILRDPGSIPGEHTANFSPSLRMFIDSSNLLDPEKGRPALLILLLLFQLATAAGAASSLPPVIMC